MLSPRSRPLATSVSTGEPGLSAAVFFGSGLGLVAASTVHGLLDNHDEAWLRRKVDELAKRNNR